MADPFATALGTLHRGPASVAAVYTPADGALPPSTIRVIRAQESRETSLRGGGRVISDTNVVEIRRSDIAQPLKGDGVVIGTEQFRLAAGPELDVEGITWVCPLEPA